MSAAGSGSGSTNGSVRFAAGQLEFLLGHLDAALVVVDGDGLVAFASPRLRELVGYEPVAVLGRPLTDLVAPADRGAIRALAEGPDGADATIDVVRASGEVLLTLVTAGPTTTRAALGGRLLTLVPARPREALATELDRHLAREARLTRLATMFVRLPSDRFDDGVGAALGEIGAADDVDRVSLWRTDEDGTLLRTHTWEHPDRAAASDGPTPGLRVADLWDGAATGPGGRDGPERDLDLVAGAGLHPRVEAALAAAGTGSLVGVVLRHAGAVKGVLTYESIGAPAEFGFEQRATLRSAAAILSEVFARRSAEQALDRQARTDELTGLTNRWACLDELEDALARIGRGELDGVSIALVDVDRFKVLNDWLGHEAGDRVLVAVTDRLQRAIGDRGRLNRLGGDELLVVVEGLVREDEAVRLAQEWRQALAEPVDVGDHLVFVTVSIGLACTADGTLTPSELVQRADAAMYRAKEQGRDRIEVDDEAQRRAAEERLTVREELRAASARGQLQVHYQPEVDAAGRIVEVEALVRWDHPSRGLLDAAEFLPLADEDAVVHAIGDVVLARALGQARAWRTGAAPGLVVGVNVSAADLYGVDLVGRIREALVNAGVAADALRLDIDERALMEDPTHALDVLASLRALGVRIAVDRFGVGNTSLAHLRRLPVDALRIAPVQVAGLDGAANGPDDAVVRGIVRVARTFGLEVVAVGVETADQLDALRALGVDRVQGHLLARPAPADQLDLTRASPI